MRLQKLLSVSLLGLAFVAMPASSVLRAADAPADKPKHEHGGGEHGPAGMLKHMHETVLKLAGITDDQKTKLDAAFTEAEGKVKEAVTAAAGDKDAAKEKIKPIMHDLHEKVQGILTDDQKAELDKMRKAHEGEGHKKKGDGAPK